MGRNRKNESSFLIQGSILAIASMISRMIGLIYRIPLTAIIGDVGNDYYGAAMEVYSILLLISSYSLPLAVSKLVSTRVAKGQRKNAYRIFKGALLFAFISGTAAGLVVYFGAGAITELLKTPLSIFALQVLAPTLLVVAVLGVFRGFFQGMGTMMPSAVSQLIEQVVNAVTSIWVAYMLYSYGARIGAVLGNSEHYGEAYGAAGGTAGTGAGALFALGFVLFVFLIYKPVYKRQMKKDISQRTEGYGEVFRILFLTIIPVLLSTTIYNISSILDQGIFKNVAALQEYPEVTFSTMWGVFVGKYKTLVNVPIALASALAASSVPSIATAFASRDMRQVKHKIHSAIRFSMVVAIPCAVGMGVLAKPIIDLLYPAGSGAGEEANRLAANLLTAGAVSIVFYSLSTLSNAILQGINRMKTPVYNAVIALVAHIAMLFGLMYGLNWNIYAVVIANAFFSFMMCILNGIAIRKYVRYRQEILKTFLIPGLSAAFMGGTVYFVYLGMMKALDKNSVAAVTAIVSGIFVYGIFMLLFRGLNETDLKAFPGGRLLTKITKKLHLLK